MNKEELEKKLSNVNSEMIINAIVGVICLIVMLMFPLALFQGFTLRFSLEVIIAFIVFIIIIIRNFNLRHKKEDLELEINNYQDEKKFKCSGCGAEVLESDIFCPNCGEKFDDEEDDKKYTCSGCHSEVSKSDKFCPNCGEKFDEDKPKKRKKKSKSKNN